jgi:hypothetical protein
VVEVLLVVQTRLAIERQKVIFFALDTGAGVVVLFTVADISVRRNTAGVVRLQNVRRTALEANGNIQRVYF